MKNLSITFTLAEALEEILKYGKFLKEVIYGKWKLVDGGESEEVERINIVIDRLLPEKMDDPGVFTIPCYFDKIKPQKALYDLGAPIN